MSDGRIQMEEFDFPYRWREAQNIQSSLVSAIQVEAQLRAASDFFQPLQELAKGFGFWASWFTILREWLWDIDLFSPRLS